MAERLAISSLFVLLAVILGGAVYVVVMQAGTGETYNPVAMVEFDQHKYSQPLDFKDFRQFHLFSQLDCGECMLGVFSGPSDLSRVNRNSGVGFGFSFTEPNTLAVGCYGSDKVEVKAVVGDFVAYLRASPRFLPGFDVVDLVDERTIPESEQQDWFSGLSVQASQE